MNDAERQAARARRSEEHCRRAGRRAIGKSATHDEKSVTFRRPLPELNLEVIKRYTLEPVPPGKLDDPTSPGYHVTLDVELRNTADAAASGRRVSAGRSDRHAARRLVVRAQDQPDAGRRPGLRDVVVRFDGRIRTLQIDGPEIAEGRRQADGPRAQALAYAGVDGQYFSAVMLPIRSRSTTCGSIRPRQSSSARSRIRGRRRRLRT